MNKKYTLTELKALSKLYAAMPVSEFLDMLGQEQRYYELYTTSCIGHCGYYTYLTEDRLNSEAMQQEIKNLKDGEYTMKFGHLKEITEDEYLGKTRQYVVRAGKP